MLLEYISRKVSKVRWIENETELRENSDNSEQKWFCGTYGEEQDLNELSIWSNSQSNYESIQLKSESQVSVGSDVTQINPITNSKSVAISLSNGDVLCFTYFPNGLKLSHKWGSVHSNCCKDSVLNRFTNEVITCGEDGVICVLNIENVSKVVKSKCLTQNSLESIDLLSANEVICGTSSGHLKVYDIRKQEVVLSMANEQSVMSCVKRNPHISHMVSCGNDVGVLSLWDMRNTGKQLMQVSGHSSLISELNYKSNEPNILITSSYDGQLLRWNISSSSQLVSVDAIMGRDGGSPINSFDINSSDGIIFSADNEVLYLGRL